MAQALNFSIFGGIFPLLEPDKLPEHAAQIAENVDIRSGGLRYWQKPYRVFKYVRPGTIRSIFRMFDGGTDYWCHWSDVVDAVRGPVNSLSDFRLYYTGDSTGEGWPKKTNLALATGSASYPDDYLELGVPVPANTLVVTPPGGAVSRTYCVTFVNGWGVEGPPSAFITGAGANPGTWALSVIPTAPASPYSASTKWDLAKRRIYRTFTDSSGKTDFYFVAELGNNSTTTYNDTTTDAVLVTQGVLKTYTYGEVSSEHLPPPSNMKGLCLGHNGIMAGYFDNYVCFSEPYNPEAWPIRYRIAMNAKVMAIIPFGRSFVIGTQGQAVIVTGEHPRSFSRAPVNRTDMACVSSRSGIKTPYGAMFATRNGYAVMGAGPAENITDPIIGEKKWRELFNPETLMGAFWEDRIVAFYTAGDDTKGFMLDRSNKAHPMTTVGGLTAYGVYADEANNRLYIPGEDGVYEWDADPYNKLPGDWMSRAITLPSPANYAAYRIDAEFSELGGDFGNAPELLAEEIATNEETLDALPTSNDSPQPDPIMMATGSPFPTGYYMRRIITDDASFAPGPNGNVHPTARGLMIGGGGVSFDDRTLQMNWYARNNRISLMELKKVKSVADGKAKRLPDGYMSDKVALRITGNISLNSVKVADSVRGLKAV